MKLSALLMLSAILLSGCANTPVAKKNPNKARLEAYDYRIKTAKGKCLQHNGAKHTLTAAACTQEKNQRFAVAGNDIRVNGLCLQAGSSQTRKNTAALTAVRCTGQPNQNWYRDGQTIRSSLNGLCLDTGKGSTVRLLRCNGNQAQQLLFSR
ncbi:ricin-type beta-trefoil lectin domain protein [Neisseria dumasiana]|uniref:ricin-type beta-trefoil lectin domain protein n=1 Tax=Neisseria dumasiana TaxID=1931275 RepID=UPI000A19551A|nr:ricin-type beta-trefoil lectin domain protein [Neisseria dumasiana]UOO83605.1 ricin-type beta-trefoil lectin domain protein [Neisseria dumasiana]